MTAAAGAEEARRPRLVGLAAGLWAASSRYAVVLVLLIGIFIFFSVSYENFLTSANIENLLASVSILLVVSIGMTFVVLTGGIDLSVGSLLALSGLILSKLFNGVGLPALAAVILTLVIGALLGGGINGVLIGKAGLSFFVVTLGTLSLYRGIVNIWSRLEDDVHRVAAASTGSGSARRWASRRRSGSCSARSSSPS